jgi:nitrogen regulatory protein P-II 1
MGLKKVTAVIRNDALARVKDNLKKIGVPHVTIDTVSGYENPRGLFEMPDLLTHSRIEVLTEESGTKKVIDSIVINAYVGTYDDGVITISPVDDVIKINTGGKNIANDLEIRRNK